MPKIEENSEPFYLYQAKDKAFRFSQVFQYAAVISVMVAGGIVMAAGYTYVNTDQPADASVNSAPRRSSTNSTYVNPVHPPRPSTTAPSTK